MTNCGDSSMAEQLDIFQQADCGSTPTSPLHIQKIGHVHAQRFVEKWHYSNRMPTGKNISYGLMIDNELYAVIVYGLGVNPYQSEFLNCKQAIEIKRMCRSEPKKDYQLSRLISVTTKWARKEMWFDMVVAFADPEHGHEGTVYKASGFEHMGYTNPEIHVVDESGETRHRRYAFRYARRNNVSIEEARNQLGLTRIKTAPKHRYCRRLI